MNASRPRLGVDFHTFDGIYQGSRSHLLGLYREAIALAPDFDFVFFLAQPDALRQAHAEFGQQHVQLIGMPHRPGPWRLLWQLPHLQRRHRLDLLHVQYRLPWRPAGRCICTIHDVLFETHPEYFGGTFTRLARFSARHAVSAAALTLTVSDYSRHEIARHYGIDPARIVLTRNAVDLLRFHPPAAGIAPQQDAPQVALRNVHPSETAILARHGLRAGDYILSLGRLEPRKNHVSLIRAYARLGAGAPPLIIVGQRDFAYSQVFDLIRELRLGERIRLLEHVDDDDLPVVLRHARLMAYPSAAEGFGMPVLEALASGVAVITSDTTSLPEVADGAAWLVPPLDVERLAAMLREALAEPLAARTARIERGLCHARRFTWRAAADQLIGAVRRLLSAAP